MEKVIRDGKVAVLVSRGWGAGGWYTWNWDERLLFHPKLVEMVEEGRGMEITEEWLEKELGMEDMYLGGVDGLCIEWLPVGTRFRIDEYDGAESIITEQEFKWLEA